MDNDPKQVGEGSYEGARDYKERTKQFLAEKGQDVDKLAHAAEDALDGEESAELDAAEQEGRSHARD